MKTYLFIGALIFSNANHAFECKKGKDWWNDDVAVLYEKASDVVYAQITEGKVVDKKDVIWKAKLFETFKGNKKGVATLTSDLDSWAYRGFVVGHTYIIYLYPSHEVDGCNYIIEIGADVLTLDELEMNGAREDINEAKGIRETFEQFRKSKSKKIVE